MSKKKKKNTTNAPRKKQPEPKKDYTTVVIFSVIILVVAAIVILLSFGNNSDANGGTPALNTNKTYYADIVIKDYGNITVQLDQHSAPITAANFVMLAQKGFYDGLTFHRIVEGFMMQGGASYGVQAEPIVGEFIANGYNNQLKHERGVISMARSNDMNSASSQFFIMQETKTHLDGQYAAFGKVISGMDVVDAVCSAASPIDGNGSIATANQPVITSITIRIE